MITAEPTYDANAKQFEAVHGFPAPSEAIMAKMPEWPLPFCGDCADWHKATESHSYA